MGKKTIEFHSVSKAFGDKTLMKDFEYIFLRNQSVGIIGPNGCGKSTMLRMITGEVLPDAGTIEIGDTIRIGYLAQEEPDMDTNQRVIDYVKDIAEYVQTRDGRISASQMLERFLFTPDMQYTPISKLSGGENAVCIFVSPGQRSQCPDPRRAVQQCGYPDADRARGFPEHICRHCDHRFP